MEQSLNLSNEMLPPQFANVRVCNKKIDITSIYSQSFKKQVI